MLSDEIRYIITLLLAKEPFIGMLLEKTWIYEVNENTDAPAWTDGLRIYINSRVFKDYTTSEKLYILAHEALHIVFKHITRTRSLMKLYSLPARIYNAVADAKVNQYLDLARIPSPRGRVTIEEIGRLVKDANIKSFEEIIAELALLNIGNSDEESDEEDGKRISSPDWDDVSDRANTNANASVLKPGDAEDVDVSSVNADAIGKRAVEKTLEVYTVLKTVGRAPSWAERLVDEILKPLVDWRKILRSEIAKRLGKRVRRTWTRPSRKHPLYPGKEILRELEEVVVLVDTSGSISEKELIQFVSEVYAIAGLCATVVVVPWDAKVHTPLVIKRQADLRKIKLTGGGGTMIKPALKLVDKEYANANVIVILSDWLIGDIDDSEVVALLKKYARKIIAVTTYSNPPVFLKTIKMSKVNK